MSASRDSKEDKDNPLSLFEANIDIICPLRQGLPLLPWKIKSGDKKTDDGRQFSRDIFDLPELLKLILLHGNNKHPVTRAPLFLSDINTNLILHKKTLKRIKYHLKKNGVSYEKFLEGFGISPELFNYLCNMKFPIPQHHAARQELAAVNLQDEQNLVIVNDDIQYQLTKEIYLAGIIIGICILTIVFFHAPKPARVDIFSENLIKLIKAVPSFIKNSGAELITLIPSPIQLLRPAGGLIMGTGSGALVVKGFEFGRKRNKVHESNYSKNLLNLAIFGILLLGLDAFTDCIGLVRSLTSNAFDRAVVLLIPLVTTLTSTFFGRATRPSPERQGELDFNDFVSNRFEYKPYKGPRIK